MAKKYDVVCTIGNYQDQNTGQTKYINRNVGSIIQTKEGYHKLVIDAHFNPAGLNKDDNGRVWLNLFEPKDNQQEPSRPSSKPNSNYAQAKVGKPSHDEFQDDELPF